MSKGAGCHAEGELLYLSWPDVERIGLSMADVIDVSKLSGDTVKFGATVTVADCDTDNESSYQIVGEYEANLESGLISIASPLAKAMIGKKEGDFAEVNIPNGIKEYEILAIEYK